jgi:PAS domain S-box-containing protein
MLVHEYPLVPIPSGKDEIGQLGQTIRQSALRLDRQVRELRRVEDQLIKLFDQLPVVCCATDGRGVIRFANRFAAETLGYEPDQMIGRPAGDFVAPGSYRASRHRLEPWLAGHGSRPASTEVWIRKDGSQVRMKVRENMVPKDAGRPEEIRWVLVCEPLPETRSPIALFPEEESVAQGQRIG